LFIRDEEKEEEMDVRPFSLFEFIDVSVLNLSFVQNYPEGFVASWTVEKTDLQLHSLA